MKAAVVHRFRPALIVEERPIRGGRPRLNLLLLGAPASGKGTQADLLAARLDIPAIATGNILRAELAERTELGLHVQAYMQRGDLVPDALMIDIIRTRLRGSDRRAGFLLTASPAPCRKPERSTRWRRR